MKKILLFIILIFIYNSSSVYSIQLKPKIYFDVESGERYMEIESDYTDYDYDIYKSYKYNIISAGYRQNIDRLSSISAIIKRNEKNYTFSGDMVNDNISNSLQAYYKRKISSTEIKIETSLKDTNFFTDSRNLYHLKFSYKRQVYQNSQDKNTYSQTVFGKWAYKLADNFKIETRGRLNLKRFEQESSIRQDADKYNIGIRFEYDFND
jgi:hypothetical protein